MEFINDFDLTPFTTFGVPASAKLFAEYSSLRELDRISRSQEFLDNEVLHIGGGSNLLFIGRFEGLVLHSAIKGINFYEKDASTAFAIAGAGEKWSEFVEECVSRGYAGLENLAGIPGEVGASAIQNVGAYGVEAGDVIHAVECFDTYSRKVVRFTPEDCRFGYRDSRFKHDWKGRYYVLRVGFRLRRSDKAESLSYGPLAGLSQKLRHTPSPAEVMAEVLEIRRAKLPDPAEIGSAGSFFKNPVINRYFFEEEVLRYHPDVPSYPVDSQHVKLPAGWLIEHAGMKGAVCGGAQVYPGQALVIVNNGSASAADVVELSRKVQHAVKARFGVDLEPEVNFIDTSISVTILGSGTSKGVPEIGCACHTCTSSDPRDKRLRASILVRTHGLDIMIDASPDFRQQALGHGINRLDALLVTHSHYDHVGGIDDLRPFCVNGNLPMYVREDVDADLRRRLDYCFREHPYPGVPTFDMHILDGSPFMLNGLKITPVSVNHGKLPIFGYRIGDFAYITDAKTIDPAEREKLYGLKVLVVNALRTREHFSHFSISEALELIKEIAPEKAYLTHFSHEAGRHDDIAKSLPDGVEPAFDGLTFTI